MPAHDRTSFQPPRNRILAVCCVLILLAVGMLVPAAASAQGPVPPRTYTAAIETLAPYQPQTRCAQYHRRGTELLGALLKKTYPTSTWYSLRPCGSGVSEHYDGRAIDWMVSSEVASQRAEAQDFLGFLWATDNFGNDFAMARRLGIMYVIFNNRMWGTWNGAWEEYNGCLAPAKQANAYDNACHRTHVHISLAWMGAFGLTSFWTGNVAQYP